MDRQNAILVVAHDYFLEHGFGGTTMSGIATEMGGSKSTLWKHFPSKEILFAAVVDRAASLFRAQLSQLLDPSESIETTLKRACYTFIERMTSPDANALYRLIISEGRRFPELGKVFFDLAPMSTRSLIASFLSSAVERGLIKIENPTEAARVLLSLSLSGCHQQMLVGQIEAPRPDQIAADADFATQIFLRAYSTGL